MILYITLVLVGTILSIVLGTTLGVKFFSLTDGYVMRVVLWGILALCLMNVAVALIVSAIPKKHFNPFYKRFKVHKWENRFYLKLGIRKWKDIIPEAGGTLVNFSKRKVVEIDNMDYLYKFMVETVYGEVMHFVGLILGFILLCFRPQSCMMITIPLVLTNFIINALPIMVQRYNRPKLMLAYNRAKREKKVDEQNIK